MEKVDSKYGVDPAAHDNLAFGCAASFGHLDVVKYLMEKVDSKYGIDPASKNNEAIKRARSNFKARSVVEYLMGLGYSFS